MNDMYAYKDIDLNICSALFIDEYAYATLGGWNIFTKFSSWKDGTG